MSGIFANKMIIGENVLIGPDVEIICDKISIGTGTVIMGQTKIQCKECIIGKNNFLNGVWIEGSLNAGNTKIVIRDKNLILQNTRLNCNASLEIGSDVNIGQNVSVWTHASSMEVFNGYPFTKAPVKIGSHIWITAGTTILPGIEIGSHVIIGNLSVVNRDIPDGCFAAGSPVKIIKKGVFPKNLKPQEKKKILQESINEYMELLKLKPFSAKIEIFDDFTIRFIAEGKETIFDPLTKEIKGELTDYSEDFRDFLRYRGIKFFTDEPFKSIPPTWYTKAKKIQGGVKNENSSN